MLFGYSETHLFLALISKPWSLNWFFKQSSCGSGCTSNGALWFLATRNAAASDFDPESIQRDFISIIESTLRPVDSPAD